MFGSFATGLSTKTSDLDLRVTDNYGGDQADLSIVAHHLKQQRKMKRKRRGESNE